MTSGTIEQKPSGKARAIAARLAAVQALYQSWQNEQSIASVRREYLEHRLEMDIDGEKLVQFDGALFKNIMTGLEKRKDGLHDIISANYKKPLSEIEPLLRSIMFCGACELLVNSGTDAPIIINDYLNVAHGFYSPSEVSLVNGVLDSVAKIIRETA